MRVWRFKETLMGLEGGGKLERKLHKKIMALRDAGFTPG